MSSSRHGGLPRLPGTTQASPADDLLLRDFHPRPEAVTHVTPLEGPRFAVIDAHAHLSLAVGPGGRRASTSEVVEAMDRAGVQRVVDLDGGWGEDVLDDHLSTFKAQAPERFACFGGVDWSAWPELGHRFPDWAAERLAAQVRRGAEGLKVWKPFGLRVKDERGQRVAVDDGRLDVLWATAAQLGIPVLIHVGDPVAFFRPIDGRNERYLKLRGHPEWHLGGAGVPTFETLIEEFGRLVGRHRDTVFIGAHVGCYAEDLAWVSDLLDRCPNLSIDISARLDELSRQPYSARRLFEKHSDRVLFGSDGAPDIDRYVTHYRFLETADEHFVGPGSDQPGRSWRLTGLNLDDGILQAVYRTNAARLLKLT